MPDVNFLSVGVSKISGFLHPVRTSGDVSPPVLSVLIQTHRGITALAEKISVIPA